MAKLPDTGNYPPSEFSRKYADVFCPKGKLVSPKDVFGEKGCFDKAVEERTRKAFQLTMKKLEKLNTPSQFNKEVLELEKLDQVSFAVLSVGISEIISESLSSSSGLYPL